MCFDCINGKYKSFSPKFKMTGFAKSFPGFLNEDYAIACYNDLVGNVKFVPHVYGRLTNMQCANRALGKVYTGDIIRSFESVDTSMSKAVLKMFESPDFISFVSSVVGERLHFVRPATPYKFEKGHYLCLHDDMSDPYHACEVVLNLSKDWKKNYGGYSVGGHVLRREISHTPDELPFHLRRIILDKSKPYYCSVPVFNNLSILKLSENLCHGTSEIKVDHARLVVAVIYAGETARNTTTFWK